MTFATTPLSIWTGQGLHAIGLGFLLAVVWVIWTYLGEPFPTGFWISVSFPIVHQVFVWMAWRLELLSAATSRTIGFRGYVAGFFLLFGGRFLSLFALAWMDRGSLQLQVLPRIVVTVTLTVLGVYAMYSVMRFFGSTSSWSSTVGATRGRTAATPACGSRRGRCSPATSCSSSVCRSRSLRHRGYRPPARSR